MDGSLFVPTLKEFTPERWNEFTDCALMLYAINYGKLNRKFLYTTTEYRGYLNPFTSQRWYYLANPEIKGYVALFYYYPTAWNDRVAMNLLKPQILKFQEFTKTSIHLVYSVTGKDMFEVKK